MDRGLRPVRRVEVDQKNIKLRVVLLVLCLLVAACALGYGFHLLVNKDTGWQSVEISADGRNVSGDFTLQYYLQDGMTAEYRQVVAVYSQACTDAYGYFDISGELGSIQPNTPVQVSEPLYRALEQIHRSGNRCIYLAPVYREYQRIFLCENEAEAAIYDPGRDPELAQQLQTLAAWCNDPGMIDLELLEDNRVNLKMSGEYLMNAQQWEQEIFLDLGWMKNAFVADYLAQQLTENGLTKGYLASFDGFTRNLGGVDQQLSLNLFDRHGDTLEKPAVMHYSGVMSLAVLRNYPMTEQDRWQYYAFSDGRIVTACVDPADGVSKSSLDQLTVYSSEASCGELVLQAAPLYLCDSWSDAAMKELAEAGIYGVWTREGVLYHTQPELELTLLLPAYTKKCP